MFLVDKYKDYINTILHNDKFIEKILKTFSPSDILYKKIKNIDLNGNILNQIKQIYTTMEKTSKLQHLIINGKLGSGKETIVKLLLKNIFGEENTQTKEVEYTIVGYGNSKSKVNIKQSKYHIVIEPNSNGFDKYLIQEIIQKYAQTYNLQILENRLGFKVVVINKIDKLSYYAQASLRRTMEKYSEYCKFILISDQLAKIVEPIRSRCFIVRIPLPTKLQIFDVLNRIKVKEDINISASEIYKIILNSDNKLNIAIWHLEMKYRNIEYKCDYKKSLNELVNIIFSIDKSKGKTILLKELMNIRNILYSLFITNLNSSFLVKNIMEIILTRVSDPIFQSEIAETTSFFDMRITMGKRHIIHLEAYTMKLIQIVNKMKKY